MSDTTSEALAPRMRRAICTVLGADERIEGVVLFGSRAKGTHREASDIDLAIYGSGLTPDDCARLREELEDNLFPWSVDLVHITTETDAALREHVERVGVEINLASVGNSDAG